jgi:hypothetical protein
MLASSLVEKGQKDIPNLKQYSYEMFRGGGGHNNFLALVKYVTKASVLHDYILFKFLKLKL